MLSIITIQSRLPWDCYYVDYVSNLYSLELQLKSSWITLQSFNVIKLQDSVYYVIPFTWNERQSSKGSALSPWQQYHATMLNEVTLLFEPVVMEATSHSILAW